MSRQVLITGANSDIGIALARRYLAEGWRVLAQFRSDNAAFDALRAEAGASLVARRADFAEAEAADTLVDAEPDLFLANDALVHLAASREVIPFAEVDAAAMIRHFTVAAVSGFLLMRRLAPAMAERGWGRVVNAGSIGVRFGGGGTSFCYSLAKHALEFMPAAVKEWAGKGVLVNTVRIGVTDTRGLASDKDAAAIARRAAMIPTGRAATSEEMAEVLYWLGSEANAVMTGQVLSAAGGE